MKRFLVVLMVLGMAASAQAMLQLSVNGVTDGPGNNTEITLQPCTTVMIDVSQAVAMDESCWLDLDPQGSEGGYDLTQSGEWVPPLHMYPAAGSDAYFTEYPDYQSWWLVGASFAGSTEVGKWFDIVFHCTGPDTVSITLWDGSYQGILDQVTIVQPEPMTIGLLGLGGLFLRRRK